MSVPVERLRHQVVELMPATIEEGVLYISLEYLTVIHRCCCGCMEKVVTPIGPTDWSVTFHGDSVSLHPSIGNWGLACESHYVIRRSAVEWASAWSKPRIDAERRADRAAKEAFFNNSASSQEPQSQSASQPATRTTWWQRHRSRRHEDA